MKRIPLFADGTWNSPEQGEATNVLRLARAVAPVAPTLWAARPGIDLLKVRFAGSHADVRAGYTDRGLGDAAAWRVRGVEAFGLRFELHLTSALRRGFKAPSTTKLGASTASAANSPSSSSPVRYTRL